MEGWDKAIIFTLYVLSLVAFPPKGSIVAKESLCHYDEGVVDMRDEGKLKSTD